MVWERDTIWRQMISQERRGEIGDGDVKAIGDSPTKRMRPALFVIRTRFGNFRFTRRWLFFLIALSVLLWLLANPILDRVEPSNCFAILCFATILWATEVSKLMESRVEFRLTMLQAVPLFVTSIMVPFLLAVLRVIRSSDGHDTRLTTSQATK